MYSIGEISKIVKVSVDTLRYYDQIDLLKPHHIDDNNRYRYYSEEQVRALLFILEMKQYGFSLDAIRELFHSQDEARIQTALANRLQELQMENEQTSRTIRHLERKVKHSKGKGEKTMPQQNILIVDDAAFMQQMMSEMLEKNGYTVIGTAGTGEAGIQKFTELKPNIVIMDIHMPEGLDGLEAARKIKQIDSSALILMCSARAQAGNILKSIENGVSGFVAKPFQPEYLLE